MSNLILENISKLESRSLSTASAPTTHHHASSPSADEKPLSIKITSTDHASTVRASGLGTKSISIKLQSKDPWHLCHPFPFKVLSSITSHHHSPPPLTCFPQKEKSHGNHRPSSDLNVDFFISSSLATNTGNSWPVNLFLLLLRNRTLDPGAGALDLHLLALLFLEMYPSLPSLHFKQGCQYYLSE